MISKQLLESIMLEGWAEHLGDLQPELRKRKIVRSNADVSDYDVASVRALRAANSHPFNHIDHGKYMAVYHMANHHKFVALGQTGNAQLHHDLHNAYDKRVKTESEESGRTPDRDFHGQVSHHWNDLNAALDKR